MLIDKEYRKRVVSNITDPIVKSFWVDEFAKYTDRYTQEATPAIQNKVGQFTSNPLIRNIVGQPKSSFDLRQIMDDRKILIVNLSKGKMGEVNANLLGSMLITKIYLAAMSRAEMHEDEVKKLPQFYLFVDEFQSFANESFSDILSEARKYKLSLTLAHQYIEQMSEEVRAAVFGNVGTMITFRVGAYDAEVLEKEFAPQFSIEDLVNLGFVQIYLKLMIDGVTSPPFSATTLPPIKKPPTSLKNEIIEHSRVVYAQPRGSIETKIKAWHEPIKEEKKDSKRTKEKKEKESGAGLQEEKRIKDKLLYESEEPDLSGETFSKSPKKKSHAKGPSEESRRELKEVLSNIINAPTFESEKEEQLSSRESKESEKDYLEEDKKSASSKEIPESVLKKILDV